MSERTVESAAEADQTFTGQFHMSLRTKKNPERGGNEQNVTPLFSQCLVIIINNNINTEKDQMFEHVLFPLSDSHPFFSAYPRPCSSCHPSQQFPFV